MLSYRRPDIFKAFLKPISPQSYIDSQVLDTGKTFTQYHQTAKMALKAVSWTKKFLLIFGMLYVEEAYLFNTFGTRDEIAEIV